MPMQLNKILFTTLLISSCLYAAETKTKIESTSQTIVSRLNPALRKALLKALTNFDIALSNEKDDSTELNGLQTTTTSSHDVEELLEESTAADLKALNLYNSYLTNGVNYTQKSKDDNEIIHTIIVKAPKQTTSPPSEQIEHSNNDQVIIQFGAPDPVKDSDVHIETVQIARSVKTNEIDDEDSSERGDANDFKVTTYKPLSTTLPPITTTEQPKTTTEAITHNEDGENIEKVSKNDVKIFQAPLVAAFTVQQDALGLPKNVISLIDSVNTQPPIVKPIQEFTITSSTGDTTSQPIKTNPTFPPITETTPLQLQLPSADNAPSFILSKSLELPTTKEAAFTTFALEQKRRELEQQIVFLQQQQRQQEETFRQQQAFALSRQQELLLQQRYRFEEENRARLQRYEQEQQILRQQQFQQSQFPNRLPSLNQLTPPPPSSSVQIIPSLSFPTQQLLPVREANDFKPKPINPTFTPSQPLPLFPGQTAPHLATGPQLPLKPAQQFQSQHLGQIDPIALNEQSRSRNRVFRQESGTGNFGLNSVDTNFPPIYPIFNADNQLQNLLLQSGIAGRSNEDLNIISKVLSLNHGIGIPPSTNSFFPFHQQGRFVRSTSN